MTRQQQKYIISRLHEIKTDFIWDLKKKAINKRSTSVIQAYKNGELKLKPLEDVDVIDTTFSSDVYKLLFSNYDEIYRKAESIYRETSIKIDRVNTILNKIVSEQEDKIILHNTMFSFDEFKTLIKQLAEEHEVSI